MGFLAKVSAEDRGVDRLITFVCSEPTLEPSLTRGYSCGTMQLPQRRYRKAEKAD